MGPRAVGITMIAMGMFGMLIAGLQHRRALKALRERCPGLPAVSMAGMISVLLGLLGVVALAGAILRN